MTGAPPLVRLASLGFPETARMLRAGLEADGLKSIGPDAGDLAFAALRRMEASDRLKLPGSVPLIRARYAVARRLVWLVLAETSETSPAPVNPPADLEVN